MEQKQTVKDAAELLKEMQLHDGRQDQFMDIIDGNCHAFTLLSI